MKNNDNAKIEAAVKSAPRPRREFFRRAFKPVDHPDGPEITRYTRRLESDDPANADLPEEVMRARLFPEEGIDVDAYLTHLKAAFFREALWRTKGNQSAAARLMKMGRTAFLHHCRRLGVELR